MTRAAAVALILVALAAGRARADTPDHHRRAHLLLGFGAVGIFTVIEGVAKNELAPAQCRWCVPDSVDASVRNALVWNTPSHAAILSNITGYALPPIVAASLLLAGSHGDGDRLLDDLIPPLEAGAYTQLVVEGIKYSVGRARPYAHYTPLPVAGNDDNLSFLSGHSALAFSIATSAGMVAHRRHYRTEGAIWAAGMSVAALTAYLRIAADKHYLTDVLAGSALGVAGGLLIPPLTDSLPHTVTVLPTQNGLALAGTF